MYHVDGQSQLRRWSYSAPLDGSSGWTEKMIGTGWGGLTILSGGTGVLYTIDSSGYMHWHQDKGYNGSIGPSWNAASGSIIGSGWNAFSTVISGGRGVIYAVDPSGGLHWFRYIGTRGSSEWAAGSGTVIGSGWNGPAKIVAGGSGVIYTVDASGALSWFLHLNPLGGAPTWANNGEGKRIGTGWAGFTQLGSVGGGIIFARDASGELWWYRYADPLGGTDLWAHNGGGVSEGVGWDRNQVVTDIGACVPLG
jgi:hypothetical protein